MAIDFNWAGIRKAALELEQEIPAGTELAPGLRQLYREEEGKLVLDAVLRDDFVVQVTRALERQNLEKENHQLKDERDRRTVADEVRQAMAAAHIRPEFLNAAVAMFVAQHRFVVREGKVVVMGKAGATDAHAAAVQWADSGEVDALLDKSPDADEGDFMRAVRGMQSLH